MVTQPQSYTYKLNLTGKLLSIQPSTDFSKDVNTIAPIPNAPIEIYIIKSVIPIGELRFNYQFLCDFDINNVPEDITVLYMTNTTTESDGSFAVSKSFTLNEDISQNEWQYGVLILYKGDNSNSRVIALDLATKVLQKLESGLAEKEAGTTLFGEKSAQSYGVKNYGSSSNKSTGVEQNNSSVSAQTTGTINYGASSSPSFGYAVTITLRR